jgi:soluble P-type ATPase
MDVIWSVGYNYPIAIHITSGDFTKSSLQSLSNEEDLPVRDYRDGAEKVDYYPQ